VGNATDPAPTNARCIVALTVLVLRIATDIRLIDYDRSCHHGELVARCHRLTDALCDVPCSARIHPYLREISRAAMPSLLPAISKKMKSQIRSATCDPCMTVPVVTLNCFRQSWHFQVRRSDMRPREVSRLMPFFGVEK